MPLTVNVHEAKTQFSRLLEQAHAGQEIILAKAGKPYARLVPLAPDEGTARKPGRLAGGYAVDPCDPSDRVLAAQAELERLVLVTRDPAFGMFAVETYW